MTSNVDDVANDNDIALDAVTAKARADKGTMIGRLRMLEDIEPNVGRHDANSVPVNVAIAIQLSETAMWPEFSAYAHNLAGATWEACGTKLRVWVHLNAGFRGPRSRAKARSLILSEHPDAVITESENRGADIGAFLLQLAAMLRTGSMPDILYKIHTKSSSYCGFQDWRGNAIRGLVGSRERALCVLRAMTENPNVGMVCAKRWTFGVPNPTMWAGGSNLFDLTNHYARDTGYAIEPSATLSCEASVNGKRATFAAGTIFAMKTDPLLRWIKSTASGQKDGPSCETFLRREFVTFERGKPGLDGSRPHAYERLWGCIVAMSGLDVVSV